MSQFDSKMSAVPEGIGTDGTLPPEVRDVADLRGDVIAWTAFDPQYESDLRHFTRCMSCAVPALLLPCCWPLAVFFCPFFCAAGCSHYRDLKNQYWVLTSTELKVITCLTSVNSIPLENITDCGIQDTGRLTECTGTLPSIYVRTRSGQDSHALLQYDGYCLTGYIWFISEVRRRRDIVKSSLPPPLSGYVDDPDVEVVTAIPVMDRGSSVNDSVEARLQKIAKLHEDGIVTTEEYAKKRQEIIDSI
jgi:hypothetical protein